MKYSFEFSHGCHAGFLMTEADNLENARVKMIRGWIAHTEELKGREDDCEEGDDNTDHLYIFTLNGMRPQEFEDSTYVINSGNKYPSMVSALEKGKIVEVKQDLVYVCEDG